MQLVTFTSGLQQRLGAWESDRVLDLQAAYIAWWEKQSNNPCQGAQLHLAQAQLPSAMLEFIALGDPALELARTVRQSALQGDLPATTAAGEPLWHKRSAVHLLPPIPRPGKIIAIGLNYRDHAAETNLQVPPHPTLFAKFATCLVGADAPVVHPGNGITTKLDYEVELAVVIGRGGRRIPEAQALQHVYGYSVMNDVSARDLQFEDGQWLKGKALDSFAPFGPAIVPADEVPDPQALNLRLTLNGQIMQDSNTRHMIFPVAYLVSYLSQLITLEPGDVISTGTPPGVGFSRKPPVYLHPGDVMTAEVEGVGALTNPIVAARS